MDSLRSAHARPAYTCQSFLLTAPPPHSSPVPGMWGEMTGDSPFNAADVPAELLQYSENSTCYPLVIDIRAPSAGGGTVFERRTAQTTFATLNEDGTVPKPVKQKVSVGGCAYELHDIYGISASAGDEKTQDDDLDDGDSLCVICLSGASVSSLFFFYPLLSPN